MNKRLKVGVVVVGAIVLSTLAINASDVLRGIDGSLTGLAIDSIGPCGADAVFLQLGESTICMDTYEASPDSDCDSTNPVSELETLKNIQNGECKSKSEADVTPWRFVTLTQAQQLCARDGKRLPTNDEWYKAAIGMGDMSSCAVSTRRNSPEQTGSSECLTPAGVHDMVGNVWEWVDGEVNDGVYENKTLPETGYITLVDSRGMVLETSESPDQAYGEDYAWTNSTGVRGIIRGGFYGSGEDAGIFTMNASVPLDFKTTGVGFRCVKDI